MDNISVYSMRIPRISSRFACSGRFRFKYCSLLLASIPKYSLFLPLFPFFFEILCIFDEPRHRRCFSCGVLLLPGSTIKYNSSKNYIYKAINRLPYDLRGPSLKIMLYFSKNFNKSINGGSDVAQSCESIYKFDVPKVRQF